MENYSEVKDIDDVLNSSEVNESIDHNTGLTKSHLSIQTILNIKNKEGEKSLWNNLFLPSLESIHSIDYYLATNENNDIAYYKFYADVVQTIKKFLQEGFNERSTVDTLIKRITNYCKAKKLDWRTDWLMEYRNYRVELDNLAKREQELANMKKRTAIENKKKKLEEQNNKNNQNTNLTSNIDINVCNENINNQENNSNQVYNELDNSKNKIDNNPNICDSNDTEIDILKQKKLADMKRLKALKRLQKLE